ncbi:hypothetical protein BDM02DRAFT_3260800 [Thelephora ganbajun]|uniref:Uncharacterized protein n=1 Tax=Thelephora ganbajun TaxID=370292 RepID=A0ACB6ZHE6_THEGA|nr:hypothetical protein BDM02DRAFT_3260800 [Thelephora ganbajun]
MKPRRGTEYASGQGHDTAWIALLRGLSQNGKTITIDSLQGGIESEGEDTVFQVVVEERFSVVGDEDGVLGFKLLAPELLTNCQTKNVKTWERELPYVGLVGNRLDHCGSLVSDGDCAEHYSVATAEISDATGVMDVVQLHRWTVEYWELPSCG